MPTIPLERISRWFICTNCMRLFEDRHPITLVPVTCPFCGGEAYPEFPSGQGAVTVMDYPGSLANGILRASGNYADGQTVTIGTDVFEIDPITTDSTDVCSGGDFNNTTDPLTVELDATAYPVISPSGTGPLIVGELIYIGTEYLRVTAIDGDNVTFERGAGGSTAAAHANTSAIYTSAATPAATKIPVGVQTTLTPAAVTPILAATINEDPGTSHQANDVTAKSLESGAVLMIVADSVGVVALPTTETGTNLAWDHTAMRRGAALGRKQVFSTAIVPDSEEATAGTIYIPLPFDPSVVQIMVVTTSTGAMKLWNGDTIITVAAAGVPAYLTVNNDGSTDWTANETIYIIAVE